MAPKTKPIKDKRWLAAKRLYEVAVLPSFDELLEIIPKTVVTKDLGMNNSRFNRLLLSPEKWVLGDLY